MKEDESSFIRILRKLQMIYLEVSDLYHPTTIVTNADPALIAALATVFPSTHHLLCIWHVQKDVTTYIKKEIYAKTVENSLSQLECADIAAII